MLPELGSHISLVILASLSFGSGLTLLALSSLARPLRIDGGSVRLDRLCRNRVAVARSVRAVRRQRYPGQQIIWQEEGVEATVVVHQNRGGRSCR